MPVHAKRGGPREDREEAEESSKKRKRMFQTKGPSRKCLRKKNLTINTMLYFCSIGFGKKFDKDNLPGKPNSGYVGEKKKQGPKKGLFGPKSVTKKPHTL